VKLAVTTRAPITTVSTQSGLSGSRSAQTGNQAARFDQLRLVCGCAALAFPADVGAAGTRDGGDDHVSRQQPVTTRTALGWSVQPLRARAVRQPADINTHAHHTSIGSVAKSSAVRKSLFFVASR
jgi:hypothetical protein